MRQTTSQSIKKPRDLLRKEIRAMRRGLQPRLRANHDTAIRQHLLKLVKSRQVKSIAGYLSFDGEPDITPLCKQLMTDGCEIALPVISGNDDYTMEFHDWSAKTTLAANSYGISEPQNSTIKPVSGFDILILPLVGYDSSGNRLGMGAGYYDRHLESLRGEQIPHRVGVAYSLQETGSIIKNDWDIPLHGVVNEHGWYTFV